MPGITLVLAVIISASAVVGISTKNRGVRLAAWSVSAIGVIGFVLFVIFVLPRLLQR